MKLRRRTVAIAAIVFGAIAVNAPAQAGSAEEAAAEALFLEAKKLMAEGKFAQACPKLAESQRLDPAVGTLLNLGECYEKNGQTASAWAAFRSAASLGRKDRQEEKERVAKERATALEGKLSKLTIVVSPEARDANPQVKRDDVVVLEPSWGSATPMDPGRHVVTATAQGKRPWSQSFELSATGGAVTVTVPALQDANAKEAPAPVVEKPVTTTPPVMPPADQSPKSANTQRTLAFVAGGVGVVGIVLGTVFGLKSKSKEKDSEAFCLPNDSSQCSQQGLDLLDQARSAATLSTIGFVVGGLGLAGGATLYLTAPKSGASAQPSGGQASQFVTAPSWPTGLEVRGVF